MTNLKELHQHYVMPTYAPGLTLVRGEGAVVWDDAGRNISIFRRASPYAARAIVIRRWWPPSASRPAS